MSMWEDKAFSLLNMKFPEKLWLIVNDCDTGAIGWGPSEETIALDYEKFQEEYLDKDVGVFKTNNIQSFVRQLNLYGFRKCNRYNEIKHEFKHPLFIKGRKDLIQYVKRKPGTSMSLNSTRIPKRSKTKTNTESNCQIENETPDFKHGKTEESIFQNDSSYATPKRNPLSSLQNPNIMNPLRRYWWNSMPSSPYPANFYCDRSIVQQGWYPMSSPYCNPHTFTNRKPEESQENDENNFSEDALTSENQLASKNNMFYFANPGFPSEGRNIYTLPGYYGGMFPLPGMSLGFNPNYNRETDFFLGEVPVRFDAHTGSKKD